MTRRKYAGVSIPVARFGGFDYVRLEHFDAAVHAATNNMQCARTMQRDRDQWKAKYNALLRARGTRGKRR